MPSADVGRVEVDANAWLVDLLRVALVRVNVVPQQHFCPQFAHLRRDDCVSVLSREGPPDLSA
eukprot:1369339-Pleurochrysis_carterae.AAC.1